MQELLCDLKLARCAMLGAQGFVLAQAGCSGLSAPWLCTQPCAQPGAQPPRAARHNVSAEERATRRATSARNEERATTRNLRPTNFFKIQYSNNNAGSGGRGGLHPTMLSCVQAAAEKETQKPWFWEQVKEHRCVPKIASPEARKILSLNSFRQIF